jgi:hypothetical protein
MKVDHPSKWTKDSIWDGVEKQQDKNNKKAGREISSCSTSPQGANPNHNTHNHTPKQPHHSTDW